jgi:transposase-like protein
MEGMEAIYGRPELLLMLHQVFVRGKQGFDAVVMEIGRMMAETIMLMERTEISGVDYRPLSSEKRKWASQKGSVYIGDQKVKVEHPRLRGPEGEIILKSYQRLKERQGFSEELLMKVLRGISCQKYHETVVESANALGVSASSVSQHIVEATERQWELFKTRSLLEFKPFGIFLDTIHRGGEAFIVALGLSEEGMKMPLGFWEGTTENHEIVEELLAGIEKRGVVISRKILWVTEGGKGVIKALRDRFGKKLLHQRCTIHKDRNIQKHLPKKYRKEAHYRLMTAMEQNRYEDARSMLLDFEKWLRKINESAADSLMEAIEEILTLHRLKVPALLRKTLFSTNPIESLFSQVRDCEGNIKHYRNSRMMQRWLGSVLLYCEKGFRRVKGYLLISAVIQQIEIEEKENTPLKQVA